MSHTSGWLDFNLEEPLREIELLMNKWKDFGLVGLSLINDINKNVKS